jgi:hypothetical protein
MHLGSASARQIVSRLLAIQLAIHGAKSAGFGNTRRNAYPT